MKTSSTLLLSFILLAATVSCKKNNTVSPPVAGDYLIVGQTGGFTSAEARATYYQIKNGELKADTSQSYHNVPADINKFNFNYLQSSTKYERVKDLLTAIPAELLRKNNAKIGTYMVDAGYTDVRTSVNGVVYTWKFEADQKGSSAEVQTYVHRMVTDFY